MTTIKNVIVAGAGGKTLGPTVVAALVKAGFIVSILSRSSSSSPSNPNVNTIETDYSPSSLESALTNQDAVISTVGFAGLSSQLALIDAAAAAGVKRFVPSEFGNDTLKAGLPDLDRLMPAKRQVLEKLMEKESKGLTWTAVANGPFIDWVLSHGSLGFGIPTSAATIYDGGDEPFTGTLLAQVGESVVSILQKPAETANKFLMIRSLKTTQCEILTSFEKITGKQWSVTHRKTDEVLVEAREKLKKGDRSCFVDFLCVQFFEKSSGRGVVAEDDCEGLEILQPTQITVDEAVKAALVFKGEGAGGKREVQAGLEMGS